MSRKQENIRVLVLEKQQLEGELKESRNENEELRGEVTNYKNLLVEAGFWNKESNFWIDIRGNHDSYDVPTTKHKNDVLRGYESVGGNKVYENSYMSNYFIEGKDIQ